VRNRNFTPRSTGPPNDHKKSCVTTRFGLVGPGGKNFEDAKQGRGQHQKSRNLGKSQIGNEFPAWGAKKRLHDRPKGQGKRSIRGPAACAKRRTTLRRKKKGRIAAGERFPGSMQELENRKSHGGEGKGTKWKLASFQQPGKEMSRDGLKTGSDQEVQSRQPAITTYRKKINNPRPKTSLDSN